MIDMIDRVVVNVLIIERATSIELSTNIMNYIMKIKVTSALTDSWCINDFSMYIIYIFMYILLPDHKLCLINILTTHKVLVYI